VSPGSDAAAFERCMSVGGVAVFGADTVYGLACDVHNRVAVERLYALKRRRMDKPSAVMFFDRSLALETLPELGEATRSALERLLPGPVTLLLPNPEGRFPLASGDDPSSIGLRVPVVPALTEVRWPVLQSSANLAGCPDARRLADVPEPIRRRADLVLDAGELPGTASTVIDLRRFESSGEWSIVRQGAFGADAVRDAIEHQSHFDPERYLTEIRSEIPAYDQLQDEVVQAAGESVRRVLDLGTGTGETARRMLVRHPSATLVGIDESPAMLARAAGALEPQRVSLRVGTLEAPLPTGPFDLVVSALCVHHLPGECKRELFERIRGVLTEGGRFVLGDVVLAGGGAGRAGGAAGRAGGAGGAAGRAGGAGSGTPLTDGYDHPSPIADQLRWLGESGFEAAVVWEQGDLAVIVADRR
jgi:tRNA threonylcarbamoyl adenosine modification protein (Sua5/YciO/YrdC/YwlC family)